MNSITDYAQTQRIVLLIDLNPLLYLSDPNPFLNSLLSTVKILLSFPALSSSLFSFKPFFSSLSPLLSSSKLPSQLALSFDLPSSTLLSLSNTVNSLLHDPLRIHGNNLHPRASNVAASMRQLLYDYAWDPVVRDPVTGTVLNCEFVVPSNLVVLFSPVCKSLDGFSEFLNGGIMAASLRDEGVFSEKLRGFFKDVNEKFIDRDIHFSWVDVNFDIGCSEEKVGNAQFELGLKLFESGIKSFGWGFCSSDSIVLGSSLVPFGLIYPKIGISPHLLDGNSSLEKNHGKLNLEILDVSGKPLECKCCELDLINVKNLPATKFDNSLPSLEIKDHIHERTNNFFGLYSDESVKIHVKSVYRNDEFVNVETKLSSPLLVYEHPQKDRKGDYVDITDSIFDFLNKEIGGCEQLKRIPIWQMFLSFLYREGCQALVFLSNSHSNILIGILKPFTVSSALLSIINSQNVMHNSKGLELTNLFSNNSCRPTSLRKHSGSMGRKKKNNRMNPQLIQNLNWSTFCKAAFELTEISLDELFFARSYNSSKKLKFFKCWMKQVKRSGYCSINVQDRSKPYHIISDNIKNKVVTSQQESETPVSSSASAGGNCLTEVSRIQNEAFPDNCLETMESFFSNLSTKIEQGVGSDIVDLRALAERLVNASIYWLYQKRETETNSQSQKLAENSDDTCCSLVVVELIKLLLREPKDLASKHKNVDISFQQPDLGSGQSASANIVREYELQILFRMEILRSEISSSIKDSVRQKFVKQICLLLENIQFHMEGGFFGNWSLDNYVGKIIKSRYADTLGDMVHQIYGKMDLLLFEDEMPDLPLNSEESNQSWRVKVHRDDRAAKIRTNNEAVQIRNCSNHLAEDDSGAPLKARGDEHTRRLIEAQKRRERARRFASFTSWMPDLQRVWTPKQLKPTKTKVNHSRRTYRKKGNRKARYDVVCETPLSGNKRPCPQQNGSDGDDQHDNGTHSCRSVSKALFQDQNRESSAGCSNAIN